MKITVTGAKIPDSEIKAYAEYVQKDGRTVDELDIHIDGEYADLKYSYHTVPFQRIRRITGYLVGTLDRFNDAKRAEVLDRVKHDTEDKA